MSWTWPEVGRNGWAEGERLEGANRRRDKLVPFTRCTGNGFLQRNSRVVRAISLVTVRFFHLLDRT